MWAAAVLALAVGAFTPTAAAGPVEVGWWLKASGSAQMVTETNHVWVEGHAPGGGQQGRLVDWWLDTNCEIGSVHGGDNTGTPFRVRLISNTRGVGCLPAGDGTGTVSWVNQYQGWRSGTGWVSGQNVYASWSVSEEPFYVFPRDPADPWAHGTLVEVR